MSFLSKLNPFRIIRKALGWLVGIKEPRPEALELQREGSDNALPVIYGERIVGGVIVHEWSTNVNVNTPPGFPTINRENAFLHCIVAFSHGEIESFEEIYFDNEPSTKSEFANNFSVTTARGTDDQLAIPRAVQNLPEWTEFHRGRNVAYAYFIFYQDRDHNNWPGGRPQITARIKGQKVYDWRTDTYAYSTNNAVCAVDYLRSPIYGRGLDDSRIDYEAWTEAADFCDEGTTSTVTRTVYIDDPDPGAPPYPVTETVTITEPRYKMAAIIDTDKTVKDNFSEILASFRAIPVRLNGRVGVIMDTFGDAVKTFDASSIVGDIKFATSGLNARYNAVTIRFPSRFDQFETDEYTYPPQDDPLYQQWLDEDNGRELRGEFEFNTFSSKSDAVQMAEIIAKSSRIDGQVEFNGLGARFLRPGMIIAIDDESQGWTGKKFRITQMRENEDATFRIRAREHEDAVYSWSGASWNEIGGGTWLGDPTNLPPVQGLQLVRDPSFATAGIVSWNDQNNAFISGYDVRVIVVDEAENVGERVFDTFTATNSAVIPLLGQAGIFDVEVRAANRQGRLGEVAVVPLFMLQPITLPPGEVEIVPRNFEITVTPLGEINLGQQFNFDISRADAGAYLPGPRFRGRSVTFPSLDPDTDYIVYWQSVNAIGEGAWVSATTRTLVDDQLDPFIDPIRDRLDEAEQEIIDAENRLDNLDSTILGQRSLIRENAQTLIDDAMQALNTYDETRERKTQFIQLSEDLSTETEQRLLLAQGVQVIGEEVEAQSLLIQDARTDIEGNTQATTLLTSRVEDVETQSQASADLLLSSGIDNGTGEVSAGAFLGVTVNGQVTGMNIFGSSSGISTIAFQAQAFEFLDTEGDAKVFFDTTLDEYLFDGHIIARSGTFAGSLVAADGTFTGELVAATGLFAGLVRGGSLAIGGTTEANAPFRVNAEGDLTATSANISGTVTATSGTIGSWEILTNSLRSSGDTTVNRIIMNAATPSIETRNQNNEITGRFSPTEFVVGQAGNRMRWTPVDGLVLDGTVNAFAGTIGDWIIADDLRSSGGEIRLDPNARRISVFGAGEETLVAMGYIEGLQKNDGSGAWGSNVYGFWAKQGEELVIDGDVEYESGDWLIQSDANINIRNAGGIDVITLGTTNNGRGLFIRNDAGVLRGEFTNERLFLGDDTNFLQYENGLMELHGRVVLSDGTTLNNVGDIRSLAALPRVIIAPTQPLGSGSTTGTFSGGMFFNTTEPMRFISASVYASATGTMTVTINEADESNNIGDLVYSESFDLVAGHNRIDIGADLEAGRYRINRAGGGSLRYTDQTGLFPADFGSLQVTESTSPSVPFSRWTFFYDWYVSGTGIEAPAFLALGDWTNIPNGRWMPVGTKVEFDGSVYDVVVAHIRDSGDEPDASDNYALTSASGATGAGWYSGSYGSVATDSATITDRFTSVAGRAPVNGDTFWQSAPSSIPPSYAAVFNGTIWSPSTLTVDGSIVASGTIGAAQLTADAIDGRIITGSIIRTAASGTRIEIGTANDIQFRNSSGTSVARLRPTEMRFGTTANPALLWTTTGGLSITGAITGSSFVGGTINIGNGNFTVDSSGVMNASAGTFGGSLDAVNGSFNTIDIDPTGFLQTSPPANIVRTIIYGASRSEPYAFYVGNTNSGGVVDANSILAIKRNGEIIVGGTLKDAIGVIDPITSSANNSSSALQTAALNSGNASHTSKGKVVVLSATGTFQFVMSGDTRGANAIMTLAIRNGSTALRSLQVPMMETYDSEVGRTLYRASTPLSSNFSATDGVTYQFNSQVSITGLPSGTIISVSRTTDIQTLEQ